LRRAWSAGSPLRRRDTFNAALIALACSAPLLARSASATITQGDLQLFGDFQSRWSGRWGEGSAHPLTLGEGGGSFDFRRWDLVQARQKADLRIQYSLIHNYNLLGRFDNPLIQAAHLFAWYRPWYDALPDLKPAGRVEPDRDWSDFNNRARVQQFVRNDLREYYLEFWTGSQLSFRIGKQQVIWSEADALSGTETTNPSDLRFHWDNFESPEDLRRNLRIIKITCELPDFQRTVNNAFEFFVIPGDWEGTTTLANGDPRSPWVAYAPESSAPSYNQSGVAVRNQTVADSVAFPMTPVVPGRFVDDHAFVLQDTPANSLDNSEFGARLSSLLPIGDGLQLSLLYLYEARFDKFGLCLTCSNPNPVNFVELRPGEYLNAPVFGYGRNRVLDYGPASPALIASGGAKVGTLRLFERDEIVRQNIFGANGSYYDNDLTDVVYRYDFSYRPKYGIALDGGQKQGPSLAQGSGARWTEQAILIAATDRPTYIPWISKQHTFLTLQHTIVWFPYLPADAVPNLFSSGKLREVTNLSTLSAVDWLLNGQLTVSNSFSWDWDDACGEFVSTNSYRYAEHVVASVNVAWFLGRSGRYTDPFLFSRDQRMNEVEFVLTYEI